MSTLLNALEPASASLIVALLNTMWQGVALFAVVWLALHLVRIVNATTRYAIWLASLILILLLPLVKLGLPSNGNMAHEPTGNFESTRPKEVLFAADPILVTRPRAVSGDQGSDSKSLAEGPVKIKRIDTYEVISLDDVQETAWLFPLQISPGRWSVFLFIGWIVGAAFMLSRVIWSYRFLSRLKKKSIRIPERLEKRLENWCGLSNSKRSVELKCSNQIRGPVAAGLTHPVILLPCHLVKELSELELDQVGLHEMAHICRWDDWTNLLQKVVEAVFFFHPAVHWIGGQLDAEREIACDDWVIYRTGQSKPYAACLTRLIELTGRVKAPVLAPGGFTTKKQIARRIEMSLKQIHHTKPRISKSSLFIGILALMFVGIQIARTLPFVAAQGAEETTTQVEETPNVDSHAEESVVAVGEESPIDEERVVDEQEEQVMQEVEETEKELEEKVRAHAAEQKRLVAIREQKYLEGARAMAAEEASALRELEEKELIYREMLGRAEVQERSLEALQLAEAPEAFLLSESGVVPFGLLVDRKVTLPEAELIELMTEIATTDPDNEVRMAAIRSIGRLGSEEASEALVRIYDSQDDIVLKKTVLSSLGWSRNSNARILNKLKEIASSDPNPELRKSAVLGLAGLPGDDGVSALISIYDHAEETDLKKFIIRYLSHGRSEEALEKLKDIARSDADSSLRLEAVQSLGSVHGGPVIGYADAPIFVRPHLSTMPVPAPDPPKPPVPPKKKN